MEISENNINKALSYLENLKEDSYTRLIDSLVEEQAYLSTFVQQNLDYLFQEQEPLKDFTFNLYTFVLYLFKQKQGNSYPIVTKAHLEKILKLSEFDNPYENLGDFIFSQLLNQNFTKEDILQSIDLLKVVINTLER